MNYELVLKNGNILTMDDQLSTARWVAIHKGKIAAIGVKECPESAKTFIDLQGKTVLPGFIDSHIHGTLTGIYLNSVNVRDAETISDVLDLIETECQKTDDQNWVLGVGLLPQNLKEGRSPTRWELDHVSRNHPVFVDYVTYHGCLLNTLALESVPIHQEMTGIERENGEPNGIFITDESVFFIRAHILGNLDSNIMKKYIKDCANYAVSKGVTTIHTLDGQFVKNDTDINLWLEAEHSLPTHIINYYQTWELEKARSLNLPRIGGCLTLDGSLFEHSEAMVELYKNRPETRGLLYHSDEEVYKLVSKANKHHMQVSMHAGGKRAIDQLLFSYYQVIKEQGDFNLRHRIEHFCQPSDKHIEMAAELGIVLGMQPMFSYLWDKPEGGPFEEHVGRTRADARDPFSKIMQAGCTICGGSDSPVTEINPLLGMHACVNNPNPVRRIALTEAIKLFTINGAWAVHEEDKKGTIEVGKFADLTVIEDDPFIQSRALDKIAIDMTIVEGAIVFTQ